MRTLLILSLFYLLSCKQKPISIQESNVKKTETGQDSPRYSLAQWSFHKQLFDGEMNNFDFVRKADELGFEGVEFVSQFFQEKVEDYVFLDSLKQVLIETEITPVMIMVDLAGDLGAMDPAKRAVSLEAHKKWVLASKYLGCQYTRVNAHGDGTPEEALEASVPAIQKLAKFAQNNGVTLLIENHGGHSSDADWILNLVEKVGSDNLKVLADFDNWCLERENGELWGAPCIKQYDRYEGIDKLLPLSRGLSLKAFDFDEYGNETKTDYKKMFKLIEKHNYNEWLGVEFEGEIIAPEKGIKMTMALAERVRLEIK